MSGDQGLMRQVPHLPAGVVDGAEIHKRPAKVGEVGDRVRDVARPHPANRAAAAEWDQGER